ncbi:MAG: leucyl/phenylalanyl-tRNA--protein transferase, partial [Spirochaetales bacterium]
FSENDPILWWCPDPRFVVFLSHVHISKSMRKFLRKRVFRVTIDADFRAVIDACAKTPRAHQSGTWISDEMRNAYLELHRLGYAHSCEVWDGSELVGGLYGVAVGRMFFGESMFSHRSNASKSAFIHLATFLQMHEFELVDSQVRTEHVETLGGSEIPREEFLALVRTYTNRPALERWSERFDEASVVKAAITDELS